VVLDQQTGQTWARGKRRISTPFQRSNIDIVELRWYAQAHDSAESAANTWLDVARRFCPRRCRADSGRWSRSR
jgi:hypothetical protein